MNRLLAVTLGLGTALGVLVSLPGCAERRPVEEEEQLPAALVQANESLASAEQAMERAGVALDLDQIGSLNDLQEQLPAPEVLAAPEVQEELELAIDSFYQVLDATNVSLDPLELYSLEAPSYLRAPGAQQLPEEGEQLISEFAEKLGLSETDEAMIHVYLSYLYTLDAVGILAQYSGDLYEIRYEPDPVTGNVYDFAFKREIEGLEPEEILALFSDEQRQAVVNAIRILTGGIVRAEDILPRVDEAIIRRSALFHLNRAAELLAEVAPELEDAINELRESVDRELVEELIRQLESWGFTVEKLPADLIEILRQQ